MTHWLLLELNKSGNFRVVIYSSPWLPQWISYSLYFRPEYQSFNVTSNNKVTPSTKIYEIGLAVEIIFWLSEAAGFLALFHWMFRYYSPVHAISNDSKATARVHDSPILFHLSLYKNITIHPISLLGITPIEDFPRLLPTTLLYIVIRFIAMQHHPLLKPLVHIILRIRQVFTFSHNFYKICIFFRRFYSWHTQR